MDRTKIAIVYAAALAHDRPGVSPDPNQFHLDFADAIIGKDVYRLEHLSNGLNNVGKQVFSQITGIALPKTQRATWEAMLAWGGISKEMDNKNQAARTMAGARKRLCDRYHNDPKILETIDWIDKQIEQGFTALRTVDRKTFLVNAAGVGFNLSKHGSGMTKTTDYIKSKIAYESANNALVKTEQEEAVTGANECDDDLANADDLTISQHQRADLGCHAGMG